MTSSSHSTVLFPTALQMLAGSTLMTAKPNNKQYVFNTTAGIRQQKLLHIK